MLDHSLVHHRSASLGAGAPMSPLCGGSFLAGGIGGGYVAYKIGAAIAGGAGGVVSLLLVGPVLFSAGGVLGITVASGLGFCGGGSDEKGW